MLSLNETYLSIVQPTTGRAREVSAIESTNPNLMTQNDIREAEEVARLYVGGVWRCS